MNLGGSPSVWRTLTWTLVSQRGLYHQGRGRLRPLVTLCYKEHYLLYFFCINVIRFYCISRKKLELKTCLISLYLRYFKILRTCLIFLYLRYFKILKIRKVETFIGQWINRRHSDFLLVLIKWRGLNNLQLKNSDNKNYDINVTFR